MTTLGITKQVPRQQYIKLKLSEKRIRKLATWLDRGDDVVVNIQQPKRDVYLENRTMRDKWTRDMIKKGHVVEIKDQQKKAPAQ